MNSRRRVGRVRERLVQYRIFGARPEGHGQPELRRLPTGESVRPPGPSGIPADARRRLA